MLIICGFIWVIIVDGLRGSVGKLVNWFCDKVGGVVWVGVVVRFSLMVVSMFSNYDYLSEWWCELFIL